jgi:hypothetical protein
MRSLFTAVLFALTAAVHADLRLVLDTEEPERVLGIADRLASGANVGEDAWEALFATNGYRDLKAREAAMQRPFTDEEFRAFVASPAVLENREALRRTLASWKRFDVSAAAQRAMRYLPASANASATVYPLIKPKTNSFVFRTDHGMAIFLYLDPPIGEAKFENTVVHELHHIGYDGACPSSNGSSPSALARRYLGGFGEGLAVLAAAGSADVHPHATSGAAERAVWERHVAKVADDIPRLEAFFNAILDGKLADRDAITREFMQFISTDEVPQGAFYTVGWTMASTIERTKGREALVALICDPVGLMRAYNAIAKQDELPTWSDAFLKRMEKARD